MASWLPAELTQMAHNTDSLFYIMLGVVAFFFVLVEVLLVTFLVRYRRTKANRVGVNVHGNRKLEFVWTLIPALILVGLGAYSIKFVYADQVVPANPLKIQVTGHEWNWQFTYPNGATTKNELRVPAGQPVEFEITSGDVIHGFYIPDLRMQQDALPGHETYYWANFEKSKIGIAFRIPCDQFCGAGHPQMVAHGQVMSQADFQGWEQQQLQSQKAANNG